MDYWAYTSCSGKHSYVEEFVAGCTIPAIGFTIAIGSTEDVPIENVLYVYDLSYGTTIILEHKNKICMGNDMFNFLANPIQSEEYGNTVEMRPRE